jgi:hypothetical protein
LEVTGTVEVTTTGAVHGGGAVVTAVIPVLSTMSLSCGHFSHIQNPPRETGSTAAVMNSGSAAWPIASRHERGSSSSASLQASVGPASVGGATTVVSSSPAAAVAG